MRIVRHPSLADPDREFIYFAGFGDHIKIGFTSDWRNRMRSLESGNPVPLTRFVVIRGGRVREGEFHEQFAHLRGSGEWFDAAPELIALIGALEDRVR